MTALLLAAFPEGADIRDSDGHLPDLPGADERGAHLEETTVITPAERPAAAVDSAGDTALRADRSSPATPVALSEDADVASIAQAEQVGFQTLNQSI